MTTASFADTLMTRTSSHTVGETVDRLAAAVENAGARVFARVDHAAGAASVGSDLRPTEMLMFGNPALGTPAMLMSQSAGLDLPLRVVVYEDAEGQVTMAWHAPSEFATTHGLPEDTEVLTRMTGALNKLTAAAAGE